MQKKKKVFQHQQFWRPCFCKPFWSSLHIKESFTKDRFSFKTTFHDLQGDLSSWIPLYMNMYCLFAVFSAFCQFRCCCYCYQWRIKIQTLTLVTCSMPSTVIWHMLVPVVVYTQKYMLHDYSVNTIFQHCTVVLAVQEDLKNTCSLFQTLNHVSRLVPTPRRYIIIICI